MPTQRRSRPPRLWLREPTQSQQGARAPPPQRALSPRPAGHPVRGSQLRTLRMLPGLRRPLLTLPMVQSRRLRRPLLTLLTVQLRTLRRTIQLQPALRRKLPPTPMPQSLLVVLRRQLDKVDRGGHKFMIPRRIAYAGSSFCLEKSWD